MAQISTERDQASVQSSAGHLRVAIWFGLSGVVLFVTFLFRLGTLQLNWQVLLALALVTFAASSRAFRDLWNMKPGATKERSAQIALAVGGALGAVAILYFSWRYGAPAVMRVLEAYLLPILVSIAFAYAAVALHVERKHKVRVFVGNRGWLYLPQEPRDSAI
jgi:Zn-dependent membrane protease YugP